MSEYDYIKRIAQKTQAPPKHLRVFSDIVDEAVAATDTGAGVREFTITNDGWVSRWSGATADALYVSNPTYPPTGYQEITGTISPTISVRKRYIRQSEFLHTYLIIVGLLRFDTSELPDTALVTGATLRLHGGTEYNNDDRNLSLEWASWTAPRGVIGDWTATVNGTAHSGVPLNELPYPIGSWFEIPLQNVVSGIQKTGVTHLKASIDGGAPGVFGVSSGFNDVVFKGIDYQGSSPGNPDYAPRLVVSYI